MNSTAFLVPILVGCRIQRWNFIKINNPASYEVKTVIDKHVDQVMKNICLEMEKRCQINFLEIGTDEDHTHFLVQSVPTY